ncbi:3'-5' exonuclease [Roseobacter denitrificans]|uniref:DNA-directed DNA polymerase n=1 Tax=Roseobacter denitrificans (strain ATCC 33942 / OCh 114) TaxID=375451 RepID=Q16B76_ROSDO|nr:exonuclease domain-containing protein [Roseobacter denitrificans]ABG30767.1 exonuclease, putative [Roseobacter denitrificans OCh 114]AVL53877.1 3'-5' exonuclease [Roseobacter denitrificans]SFG17203.1 DNA polymerase-3 subunit epsilon [Roseobacter denitrificans OCh 114]
MKNLSLRLRVFLFFCLTAFGSIAICLGALYMGFRQLGDGDALSAFITSGVIAGFGILGLVVLIWLLFDENVSKPIEALAASLRVRTHVDIDTEIEAETAKYLGDLAPAVCAIHRKLRDETRASSEAVVERTARLDAQRSQLLQILSDIPVAVIVARQDHQIILYDGQAADLMERECPARLKGSVFDYLDKQSVLEALSALKKQNALRHEIALKGRSGAVYKGHIRVFGADAGYTLMLEPLRPDAARPLVYDFDLLDFEEPTSLDQTRLRDLTFVVFDSETTGLDPHTDEVVQLGAVRVVNGKIIEGEVFDTLVNPGRTIPPGSTAVHQISDAMVADAPGFDVACRAFHQFAEHAVIVAHNAPFDMAFLRRQCRDQDYAFDNPILDTVHLSAVVFGGSAEHTLDALCDRLNVHIPDDVRHTGLGDALATAKALVALIPVLEARGFTTFEQVRAEIQKHSRILKVEA